METNHMVWGIVLILLIFEQFLYWIFMPYPYRYGLSLRSLPVPVKDLSEWKSIKKRSNLLAIHIREDYNEIYFHLKYPPLTLGPLLFVGYIKVDSEPVMKVRVGIITLLLIACAAISALLSKNFTAYSIINIIILLVLALFPYIRFIDKYKKLLMLLS